MKQIFRTFLTLSLICFFLPPLQAQEKTPAEKTSETEPNDNNTVKPNYAAALGGVLLTNATIASWNRFILKASWAQVSIDDMLHFYEKKLKWDTDWYWTNFVLHPYQGGLDYMSARDCGLSPVASAGFTLLGSTIWEYFCELNAPSINDMIYTPVGGAVMGEMLYRLSLEADAKNKYLSWIVNPLMLYSVPVTGKRPQGPTGQITEMSYSCMMGSAIAATTTSDNFNDANYYTYPVYAMPRMDIVYGNPYGLETNTFFKHFDLTVFGGGGISAGLNPFDVDGGSYNITLLSDGFIFSRAPDFGENKETSVGMIFDYDFIWNPFIEISTLAPGFAIKQRITEEKKITEWALHIDTVILGTSDFYPFVYEDKVPDGTYRNYSYNIGFEGNGSYKKTFDGKRSIKGTAYIFVLYDFLNQKQQHAKTGWEFAGIGTLSYEHKLTDKVSLGFEYITYYKLSLYSQKYHVSYANNSATSYYYTDRDTIIQQLHSANMFVRFSLM